MSFFAQTQRKTNLQKMGVPSPGDYNPMSLSNSRKYSCAPFGSTQRLNRSNFKQKLTDPQKKQRQEDNILQIKELDMQLKTQQQVSSMFKSETHRFRNQTIQEVPGPGQYDVVNKPLLQTKSHKVISRDYHLNIKPSVPSIPIDNLGFKEDQNNQMKKVQAPKYATPDPGTYQIKQNPMNKGVVPWKTEKMMNRMSDYVPGPGQYSYQVKSNKSLSSCFTSTTDRFGAVKKIKQDKMPGPGSYNAEALKKMSHNISSEGYFNSKRSRFENNSHNQSIGPGAYFNEKKKSHSVNQIRRIVDRENDVINKPPPVKTSIFQSTNKNPGPGQYKTNYGISYQLHKALIKKQTTDTLPKEKRKVFQPKPDQQMPGPGTYETPTKSNPKPKGKLWKKTEVVNLKEQPQITPSPMDYHNLHRTIQAKVKQMNSKLTLTEEKPFNSGTQRFKHYTMRKEEVYEPIEAQKIESEQTQEDLARYNEKKKVKRLVMTTIKVRVPFGISSSKFQQKNDNYYGPDFYKNQKEWLKPSFNIKSKLQ